MKTKLMALCAGCFVLLAAGAVHADLLFSYTQSGGEGGRSIRTNEFLPTYYYTPPSIRSPLFELPWSANDVGSTRTETSSTSTNFNAFIALMTDGIQETILFAVGGYAGTRTGFLVSESTVVGRTPDLSGYRIDSISLHLNSLSFSTPGTDPNHDGLWTDVSFLYTLTANGAQIPEPSSTSLVMLSAGILWPLLLHRRGKRSASNRSE
jgi:hypothetical protein